MIKLKEILNTIPIVLEGGKLFGSRAQRVSTQEMNLIYKELEPTLKKIFDKIRLSRALPAKEDHGDIDILVTGGPMNLKKKIELVLGNSIVDYSRNGEVYSILYKSSSVPKTVHVDLNRTPDDEFETHYDYLSYNDFSGILGIIARKLNFNYGTKGFFKIYIDKKGIYHYILLTKNLREGLIILGYKNVLPRFDHIQTINDIVDFMSSSDLFDSKYLESFGMNSSDRKRSRSERPTARAIRDGLLNLHKSRRIDDENYFLKKEFPQYYQKLLDEIEKIDTHTIVKPKYGGEWLMKNFPDLKPGPIIGQVKNHWQKSYGSSLNDVPEDELYNMTRDFLKK